MVWEYPRCNLCQGNKIKTVFDNLTYWEYPGIFRIVECVNCGFLFTSPRPSIKEIEKYYKQGHYFGRDISNYRTDYDDVKERETAYGPVYNLILQHKSNGKILDIGAGTGLFLSKFKDLNWSVNGVELTSSAVLYAKKRYDIVLSKGDFFDFKYKEGTFDVITLNGVLEHLYNPKETLSRVHRLLRKDGILVFSVPNIDSFGKILFGKNWFPWQPPRHLYHFSPKTISLLLNKTGFSYFQINQNYHLQNKYILFQSFRYMFSPKFAKGKKGGLINTINNKKEFSLKKEIGKIGGKVFFYALAFLEPFFKKGEVMIVYAKK